MPHPRMPAPVHPDATGAHVASASAQERTSESAVLHVALNNARDCVQQLIEADARGPFHGPHSVPVLTLARAVLHVCDAVEAQQRDISALTAIRHNAVEWIDNLLAANKGFSDRNHRLEASVRRLDEVTRECESLRAECITKADAIIKLTAERDEARATAVAAYVAWENVRGLSPDTTRRLDFYATLSTATASHDDEHADRNHASQSSASVTACNPPHGMHARPSSDAANATGEPNK